jgi:hypothetical protein
MNNAKKQISSGAVINLAGILLGAVLNLWLLPKLFSTEELGMYRWMERSAVLLSNILLFGVHRSFTKFHSDPIERIKRRLRVLLSAEVRYS